MKKILFLLLFLSINILYAQSDTIYITRVNDSTSLVVRRVTNADLTYSESASLLKDTTSEVGNIYNGLINLSFQYAGLLKQTYIERVKTLNTINSNNRILTSVGVDNFYNYTEKVYADSTNIVGEWDVQIGGVDSKLFVWKNAQGALLSSPVSVNGGNRILIRYLGYNGTVGLMQIRFDGTNFVDVWFQENNDKGKYTMIWRGQNLVMRKVRGIIAQRN